MEAGLALGAHVECLPLRDAFVLVGTGTRMLPVRLVLGTCLTGLGLRVSVELVTNTGRFLHDVGDPKVDVSYESQNFRCNRKGQKRRNCPPKKGRPRVEDGGYISVSVYHQGKLLHLRTVDRYVQAS